MPFAAVDYLGLDYGVKGPGEVILPQVAAALARGDSPRTPALLINEGNGTVRRIDPEAASPNAPLSLARAGYLETRKNQVLTDVPYHRVSGDQTKVDNHKYYHAGGLGNILTKSGCPFSCTHCVEPDAKGSAFSLRSIDSVVSEMESLTDQGVYDLHTTDSEFNLAIGNSKRLLTEIIRRREVGSTLQNLRLWIYAQPEPFDEEFAELLSRAGCAGVNVAPDHVVDNLLDGWKITPKGSRFYRSEAVDNVVALCKKYDMLSMVEALLGMPGETLDTLNACIDHLMSLDATVVGFTLGLRIFPYSPLGMWAARQSNGSSPVRGVQSNTAIAPIIIRTAEQCATPLEYERQFIFNRAGDFRPLYYFSPELPEPEETTSAPNGRWLHTLEHMWRYIPAAEHHRVMLPTAPGLTEHDNNYADNPFLTGLVRLARIVHETRV